MWSAIIAMLITTNDVHTDITKTVDYANKVDSCREIESSDSVKELYECGNKATAN